MAKFNAIAIIVGEDLEKQVVDKALDALRMDGGDSKKAALLVQVNCDEAIGSAMTRHGETDIEEALELALQKWVACNRSEFAQIAMISVTAIDGTRCGDSFGLVALADYYS